MKSLQILVLFLLVLSGKNPVLCQNRVEAQVLVRGNVKFEKAFYSNGKLAYPREPSKDAVVVAVDKKGNKYSTKTDENGHYEIKLPIGEYQMQAFVPTGFSVETSSDVSNLVIKKNKKVKLNFILFSRGCG